MPQVLLLLLLLLLPQTPQLRWLLGLLAQALFTAPVWERSLTASSLRFSPWECCPCRLHCCRGLPDNRLHVLPVLWQQQEAQGPKGGGHRVCLRGPQHRQQHVGHKAVGQAASLQRRGLRKGSYTEGWGWRDGGSGQRTSSMLPDGSGEGFWSKVVAGRAARRHATNRPLCMRPGRSSGPPTNEGPPQ